MEIKNIIFYLSILAQGAAIATQFRSAILRLIGDKFQIYTFVSLQHEDPHNVRFLYALGQLGCLFLILPATVSLLIHHFTEPNHVKLVQNASNRVTELKKQQKPAEVNQLTTNAPALSYLSQDPKSEFYRAEIALRKLHRKTTRRASNLQLFRTVSLVVWFTLLLMDVVLIVLLEKILPGHVMMNSFWSLFVQAFITYGSMVFLVFREVLHGMRCCDLNSLNFLSKKDLSTEVSEEELTNAEQALADALKSGGIEISEYMDFKLRQRRNQKKKLAIESQEPELSLETEPEQAGANIARYDDEDDDQYDDSNSLHQRDGRNTPDIIDSTDSMNDGEDEIEADLKFLDDLEALVEDIKKQKAATTDDLEKLD